MYLLQRYPWVLAYGATLAIYAFSVLSGLAYINFESFLIWFPMVLIGDILLIFLLWALIWMPIRYLVLKRRNSFWSSFVSALKIGLFLGFVALTWRTWLTTQPDRVKRATTYVEAIAPLLERYYDQHQHYPSSLSELNSPTDAPWGLIYTAHGEFMNEWPSGYRDNESYSIFFGDLWYRDKEWEFGGL